MSTQFDPYREWLGLEAGDLPPSHYQLLGLTEFESDIERIVKAADARMAEVRQYQTGPRGRFTHKILNELSTAKLCLLDAKTKKTYDAFLQGQRAASLAMAPAPMVSRPAGLAVSYVVEPPVAPPPTTPPPVSPPAPPAQSPLALQHSKFNLQARAAVESVDDREPSTTPWLAIMLLLGLIVLTGVTATVIYLRVQRPVVNADPEESNTVEQVIEPPPGRKDQAVPEAVVMQEGTGDLNFPLAVAELSGGLERREENGKTVLSGFGVADASARWRFKVVRPAIFKVQLLYVAKDAAGGSFEFTLENDTKLRGLENGDVNDEFFWKVTSGGEQTLDLKVLHLPNSATLELQSISFIKQDAGRLK